MNLAELFDHSAALRPRKIAVVEDASALSYAELGERIETWAARMGGLGFPAGSRVGLRFPNGADYIALTFALWKIRAVVVPVPTECSADEMAEISESLRLVALLLPTQSEGSEPLGPGCFLSRLNPSAPADNHGLNLAFIRFTSGTTSARKGVALSHETIHDRVTSANKAFKISQDDTVMWCLPMAHHFLITIVLYLLNGATVVLVKNVWAKPYLELVNRTHATVLYAAPFHYAILARDNSGLRMDSVRLAVSTTCSLPSDVAELFHKRFSIRLASALGVIELGLASLNTDPAAHAETVGPPAGDFQVKVFSPDANGYGEVGFAGPGMFDAYAAPWVPRSQVLRDGWFLTGDVGRLDNAGFLQLAGRKTAVINMAGKKVFPEEIEAVLNRCDGVRESRVFGRQHPHLGEVVEAEIVSAGSADGLLESLGAFCRQHLAMYKIPTRFHLVTAVPRTPVTGKIVRETVHA